MPRPAPMTAREFGKLKQRDPKYYTGRWPYFRVASEMARGVRAESVLELGPYRQPLVAGSALMDIEQSAPGVVKWDARITPWPVEDMSYDLFVALQVWEHLGNAQVQAFAQVRRIARHAVLSFPLDWKMADTSDCHHGIDKATIKIWTHGLRPSKSVIVRQPDARYKRMVCLFDLTR